MGHPADSSPSGLQSIVSWCTLLAVMPIGKTFCFDLQAQENKIKTIVFSIVPPGSRNSARQNFFKRFLKGSFLQGSFSALGLLAAFRTGSAASGVRVHGRPLLPVCALPAGLCFPLKPLSQDLPLGKPCVLL